MSITESGAPSMSKNRQRSRRTFMKASLAAPLVSAALPSTGYTASAEIYKKLGVKTFINAYGTLTTLSGTLMPPEVTRAMTEASKNFVEIHELQDKAGKRLAELTGAEAAFVTNGASAALC